MQGAISVYIGFSSLCFFPVSTVGVICTLKPIIVIIFDKLIFGSPLTCRKILVNALLFFSVCLVICGVQNSSGDATLEDSDVVTDGAPILATIALVSQPALLAGGDIAIRKMAKLPEMLPSAYQNLTLMILAAVYIIVTGLGFDFMHSMSRTAWILISFSCFLNILMHHMVGINDRQRFDLRCFS